MSKLLEYAAMLLGGISILAVCFLGFSLTAGVPLHRLAVVGKFFEQPADQPAPQAVPPAPVASAPATPERAKEIVQDNVGVLGTWKLPSPFDAEELSSLAEELKAKNQMLDARAAELEKRSAELDDRQKLVEQRFDALRELLKRLEDYEGKLAQREQAVRQDEAGAAEKETKKAADLAKLFDNLEPDAGASFLAAFSPEEAAAMLHQMDVERAAELLNALRSQPGPKDWKAYLDAYSKNAGAGK